MGTGVALHEKTAVDTRCIDARTDRQDAYLIFQAHPSDSRSLAAFLSTLPVN